MAEKILNTRILMKVDTLENWKNSTLKLKNGELAFATVAAEAGTGLSEPVVMVKIGTAEEKTFSELPWAFHAKAADVLAACKSTEALTEFVNGVIKNSGLATDGAMKELAADVEAAEEKIATLEGVVGNAEGGLVKEVAANATAIAGVKGLVGDEKVADQISTAIAALNLADTYAAKVHGHEIADVEGLSDSIAAAKKAGDDAADALATYKTTNDAAVKVNSDAIAGIKNGETIANFKAVEEALAGKQAAGDYSVVGHKHEIGDVNGLESAIADAKKAGTDAAGAAAQVLVDAKGYTDSEMTRLVGDTKVATQISTAITDLDLANTYAAKEHTHTKSEITDFAHTHTKSEITDFAHTHTTAEITNFDEAVKAYDYATKAEAQGYANAKDEAIAAAQAAADKAQGEVDALETYVGTIPEGYTEASVIAYINKKAEETLASASGNSTETAASVKAALDTYKTENNAAVKANADAIAALDELVGDESVAKQIEDAVAAEAEIARAAEKANADAIKAIKDDYLVEADKTELTQAIADAKQEAIATVLGEGTSADFDTLKEVADWILSDTTGAAALQTDVAAIKADYLKGVDKTELEGKITAAQNAADTAQGEVDALEEVVATKAAASDLTTLAGRVTTVENDLNTETTGLKARMDAAEDAIEALDELVGDESVDAQIKAAIDALSIGDYAKAADLTAAINQHATDKTALEGAIALKANDADLAAVAKSGLIDDLTIGEGTVLVFDCGNAEA